MRREPLGRIDRGASIAIAFLLGVMTFLVVLNLAPGWLGL